MQQHARTFYNIQIYRQTSLLTGTYWISAPAQASLESGGFLVEYPAKSGSEKISGRICGPTWGHYKQNNHRQQLDANTFNILCSMWHFMLALSSSKCNIMAWCPSIRLSIRPIFLPAHLIGQYCFARGICCLSASSVMLPTDKRAGRQARGRSAAAVSGAQAIEWPTLRGGPVWLRPVKATPCF